MVGVGVVCQQHCCTVQSLWLQHCFSQGKHSSFIVSCSVQLFLTAKQRERTEPVLVCFLAHWSVLCRQFPHICGLLCREEKMLPVVGLRRQEGAQVSNLSVGSTQGGCSKEQEGETSASFGNPAGKRRENREDKRTMALVGSEVRVSHTCLKCFTAVWVLRRVTY